MGTPTSLGPRDATRIDVYVREDLEFWARELGVDAMTLKATVNRVGPIVEKVRQELQRKARV